ncbi:choice-of-anchor L domain-containing protein, partial [Bizionia paragorgiae]|uniref:choice-of-anchor L domain-containing protein n=1 Tax=Bizionia paragorgiae TaxID=283786 RepID=UPI00299F2310
MKNFTLAIVLVLTFFSASAQDILMQNGTFTTCSGNFYDSGGVSANYSNNETFEVTICPDVTDASVQVAFTAFSTQGPIGTNPGDVLTVYDGDDTSAPVLGTFAGGGATANPDVLTASPTNTSGCLTFVFVSNDSGNTSGWAATIDCLEPCQTITPSIDATTPAVDANNEIIIADGDTVTFDGSAIFSEDGTGAEYSWNFGDGSVPVIGESASHTFNGFGNYTVTLTVTDTNPTGCSEQVTVTVVIPSPYIQVSTTDYTVEQLITDVLIDSPCAAVSNVTSSTGSDFGSANGIGSFISTGGVFEFDGGILLSSGSALDAEGPETGTQSAGNWGGDTDLEGAIGLPPGNTNDATYIQFEFIPIVDNISFDFIFASEEYGQYQCVYTDAFAFLLTDIATGVTTNLAIVPGTTDVVSVLNVRDSAYNNGCPSVNPTFFDAYYDDANGLPEINSPTNFKGYTVPMTASATVIPNNTYRIKLVVADAIDSNFDAGVFLGAGSFNLGGNLGEDITISAGTAECEGTTVTLDTGLPNATHTWYLDGNVIAGETASTYDATVEGTYSVDIVFSASCQASDSIFVEFIPGPTVTNTIDLIECNDGTGAVIFDLTENDAEVLGTQDPTIVAISYYTSQADADAGTNPIVDPENYSGTDGEQIYVRIEDLTSGTCADTDVFTLSYLNVTYSPASDMVTCDDPSNDGVGEAFDLESQNAAILGAQSNTEFTVSYYTTFADADAGTNALVSPYDNVANAEPIYVRVESIASPTCYVASPTSVFSLNVNPVDDASFTMVATCDGGTVDTFATAGGTYAFNPVPTDAAVIDPATGAVTGGTPGATYTVSYTTNGGCPASSTFDLTVLSVDDPTITMIPTCDGGIVDSEVVPGGTYVLNPLPTDGATIDATTGTVTGGQPDTTYGVEYTTNGACPATQVYSLTTYPLP